MKVLIFASGIVTFWLFTRALIGQVSPIPKEPEFVNAFSYLEKDGVLRPLERQAARISAKAMGYGAGRASYVIPSDRSTVRFSADTDVRFVVRPAGPSGPGGAGAGDVDPATIVQLYRLKVTKGQRELQIVSSSLFRGSMSTQEESKVKVEIEITKYGKQSVVMKPLKPLLPGEYMWAANAAFMVPQAYCFGIDSAKP